jgi:LysR family glycine cleavage system transcriptional activator
MARRLPPLNPLRNFEAAARHRSLTLAAGELNVTQVAVSRQVRALEKFLEVRLFDRKHRAITLTREGARLLPALTRAFDLIAETTSQINRRGRRDLLCIQAYTTFAQRWLIPLLSQFHYAHPEIEVRLTSSSLAPDFNQHDIDAAIQSGDGDWPDLEVNWLAPLDLVPVCSPSLLAGAPKLRQPADLRRQTLLHSLARPNDWSAWLTAAGVKGIDTHRGLKFESSALAYEAAIQGTGVAIGLRVLLVNDLRNGILVAPFPLIHRIAGGYYLVRPKGRRGSKAFKTFQAWLLREMDKRSRQPKAASAIG